MKTTILGSLLLGSLAGSVTLYGSTATNPNPIPSEKKASVESTERELKALQASLRDLQQQIRAIPRTATEPGLGPQLIEAKRSFDYAMAAFEAHDWLTVIQESSRFLSLSQKPERKSWLKAQFMIGRAYEEQGQFQRAIRAYRRYLATFTTEPTKDLADLTETFERLVRIATKSGDMNQAELSRFLSSIAAMEYPADVSPELQYFVAIASSNIGKKKLASSWLTHVDVKAKNPETRARAKYFRALLAINAKDWNTATDELETVLQMDEITEKSKDNARLSLARVFLKQKKPDLSLKTYEQIKESSDAYRDALFEKTFLLARNGKDAEARSSARQWLAKYPEHTDADQLRGILSWLELRAGDLTAAKKEIDSTAAELVSLRESLQNDFKASSLRHDDAMRLHRMTKGVVAPAAELEQILAQFDQIAELTQRLADIDGAERGIIYTIAKGDLGQFKPSLANRIYQYDSLADKVLSSGARLMDIERQRLAAVLTDLDKQKLQASERRRQALYEKHSRLFRQYRRWASWAEPADQLVKLAQEWESLGTLQATFNAKIQEISVNGKNLQSDEVVEIRKKIELLKSEMVRSLVDIRKIQASSLVEQSDINDVLYIVQQYASALHEESRITSAYEPQTGKILDAFDDEDSRSAWALWHDTVGNLHENLKSLKTQAGKDLADVFAALEKIEKARTDIERELGLLKNVLETYGGESIAGIINHYDHALSERIARQYKWAGDLEYLNYVNAKSDQNAIAKKQALETQILSDNLRDIEQGVASQWPR